MSPKIFQLSIEFYLSLDVHGYFYRVSKAIKLYLIAFLPSYCLCEVKPPSSHDLISFQTRGWPKNINKDRPIAFDSRKNMCSTRHCYKQLLPYYSSQKICEMQFNYRSKNFLYIVYS